MSTGPRPFSDTDKKAQDPLTRKHQTNQKNPVSTSTISSLLLAKRPKRPLDNDTNGTNMESNTTTTSEPKSQTTEVKRRKVTKEGLNQNVATDSSKKHPCAFCHSSKQTEGSGPLVSYSGGLEVKGSLANFSKVTHVHSKCIQWAPMIYFSKDGKIQNLESELLRANKLKCTKCGKKGAGLGCYMEKCQRTYHVPCAYDTPDCRWDVTPDSYLILCPKHAKMKFPSEVDSDNVKKDTEKIIPTQLNPCTTKNLVFCGSDLSTEEKCLLVDFACNNEAVVSKYWRDNVTHVIAAIDSNLACIRTYKVLMAVLNGKWVVTVEWVKACAKFGSLVNEEPYEVQLDTHGCTGGPKSGRVSNNGPSLFKKLKFYFVGDFVKDFKTDLVTLVISGGGKIIETKDELLSNESNEDVKGVSLVVYNADVADHSEFDDEDSIKDQRLATAQDIAQESRSHVIQHIWILESIAACRVLPFT